MSGLIHVSLCVNNPEDGSPHGHVTRVDFDLGDGASDLELEGDPLDADANPTCSFDLPRGRLRVGRRVFQIHGYKQWFGNWCWDAALMELTDARRLVAHLMACRFTVDAATEQGEATLLDGAA